MNSLLTTLAPAPAGGQPKTVLSKNGFTCTVLTLAPGDELRRDDAGQIGEHVLYLLEGWATVSIGDISIILEKDRALHLAAGRVHTIAANAGSPARLLRVDVPPRAPVEPQIVTLETR